ncbi:MAG: U32 family peptidase, partial [Smithella sp.]
MVTSLELLAPAGNADVGIAAIDHGADAVYIGAPKFSARADAGVSVADIARLIKHAHLYYARVYVALNTILTDRELDESLDIIRKVYELGADALIIQDVGLLELDLPPIPLIASTQMHNNTVEKIQFLEAVGFQRVILARELSLDEIADIRRNSNIELEAFVHGALCVSYSGQCYMSQAITGRSGNRGVCAQPCRSHYTLIDGDGNIILQNKFLLSLKDLNLMDFIPDLIAAGVTSFKIEGRYKGIEYVKNVTAAFRQAIDQFISAHAGYRKSSSGVSTFTFSPAPERTFNRGYTQYFIAGGRQKVASLDTQKSIGQYLGEITSVGKDFFRITHHDLQNGDGLCFFTKKNDLAGFRVEKVDKGRIYPNNMTGLEIGTPLYRNYDIALTRALKKSSADRRIAVEMNFRQENTLIRLVARDEDGNVAEAVKEILFEPSRDPVRAVKQIETHLTSTGNTPYRT